MIVPPSAVVGAAIDARARARDALAAIRADGWESSLLGIGTSEDKIASLRYNGFVNRLTDPVLEGMFMTEIYAFRGVTIYPHVAFSEGCEFKGLSDDDAAREYLNEQWRLPEICTEAAIWGRLYGGCATWIVTDRSLDELQEPLDPGEEILALRNVERPFVTPMMDPTTFDPAGNPTFFMLNPPQGQIHTTVHVSRLSLWPGDLTPQRRRIQIGYWDFSVLQRPFDVLKRNGHVNQAAQQLLSEASLGILAIKDLWTSVSSGQQGQLLTRIRMFNQSRAQARAVIIDKEREEFSRVNTTFAGVSDITDRMRQEVAAAFGIPVTRLMGEAPAGLNATGDADEKNFHKDIASYQRSSVEPRIHKLARALLDADQSPIASDGLTVKWPDLGAPSTAESATIYSTIAQADAALIDREVITPEQAKSRFTPEGYSQDLDVHAGELDANGEPADPLDLVGVSQGGNTPDGGAEPDQKLEPQSITALVDLISQAAKKTLPRDSVQEIIVMAFGVTPEQADKLLGSAGKDFEPPAPPTPVLAPGAKAPPPKGPPGAPPPPKQTKTDEFDESEARDSAGMWTSSGSSMVARPKGWKAASDAVSGISRKGHLYRGMSAEEFHAVNTSGEIKSNERDSFAGEGTNFASDAETAESYANSGRADPRLTGKTTYLVEVKSDIPKQAPDGYFKAAVPVPVAHITRAWRMAGGPGIDEHDLVAHELRRTKADRADHKD